MRRDWFGSNFKGAFDSLVVGLEKREGTRIEIDCDAGYVG
jgi:hypothetical protein